MRTAHTADSAYRYCTVRSCMYFYSRACCVRVVSVLRFVPAALPLMDGACKPASLGTATARSRPISSRHPRVSFIVHLIFSLDFM